ncbi:hypothetical protein ACFQX4_22220 [Roseomonas sp. GCM10028921]
MLDDMAHVPVPDTASELALRASLARLDLPSPERDLAGQPGHPNLILRAVLTAFFVHGCFWHHHAGCRHTRPPNTAYP